MSESILYNLKRKARKNELERKVETVRKEQVEFERE
jgi:hypothetical protein